MNQREKILAILAFAATGVLVVAFVLVKVILGPTDEYRSQAQRVAADVEKYESKNRREPSYKDALADAMKRSYGDDPSTASEMSRAHLVKLIAKAGLSSDDLSMTPVTGRSVKGGREVGWVIRVKGPVEKLTSFLYVVNKDPHLHKLDNVAWSPMAGTTDLSLQARFATLVLEPVEKVTVQIDPDAYPNTVKVDSPERRWYAMIGDRDIFRPYIKRPPAPVQPRTTTPSVARTNETPRVEQPAYTPTSPLQLVGLPTWNNEAEVVIKDTRALKNKTYKIGEELIGGKIVMVDYRPLPLPMKPQILSASRVIVRVDRAFYAIELGQYLTDKYLVTADRLPDSLRDSIPASAPVSSGVSAPVFTDSPVTSSLPPKGSRPVSKEASHAP